MMMCIKYRCAIFTPLRKSIFFSFERMKIQYILSSVTACLEVLIFSGVLFGFSSLQFVLEQEGYFEYLCNSNATNYKNISSNNSTITCAKQAASFNLAFSFGVFFSDFISFPLGVILDSYGTWIFRTIITGVYTLSYLLLAVSTPNLSNLVYPFLILLAISGRGIIMSNFQVANLSKTIRGFIITLLNGLYDSSVMVFLLVKKAYDFGFNLNSILRTLTCCTLLLWLRSYVLLPKKIIPYPLPSADVKYGWQELVSCCKKNTITSLEPLRTEETALILDTDAVDEEAKKISFKETLKSILYWTNFFHYSVIAARLVFFFSSFLTWLRTFNSSKQISRLTDNFGLILLFGVCVAPLNGIIVDFIRKFLKSRTANEKMLNLKASFVSMLITSSLSIIYSALALKSITYGAFVFHLLTRGFLHGGYADFLASNFSFYHFGKLYGLGGLIYAFIALSQYGLFQIAINFDPDFYYIDTGWLIACVLTLLHPLVIYLSIQKFSESES